MRKNFFTIMFLFLGLPLARAERVCGSFASVNPVQMLYDRYLGREADPQGLNTFMTGLVNGSLSIAQIENAILGSAEYAKRGGKRGERITTLYRVLLNRYPDATGLRLWVGSAYSLPQIASDIMASAEYKSIAKVPLFSPATSELPVLQLYQRYLGRLPESSSAVPFLASVANGTMTLEDLENIILNSTEFKNRETSGPYSPSQVSVGVNAIYEALLHREADPGGLRVFINLATSGGLSYQRVANQILGSGECSSEP